MADSTSQRSLVLRQSLLFLLLWNLANTGAWAATWLVFYWISLRTTNSSEFVVLPVGWFSVCLFVGVAQWSILRNYVSNFSGWASLVGWSIATLIGGIVGFTGILTAFVGFAVFTMPFITGLFVGVAQWVILRRKLSKAYFWIWATTIGAIAGVVGVYAPLDSLLDFQNSMRHPPTITGIGIEAISSIVTGCTMLWLLKLNSSRRTTLDR